MLEILLGALILMASVVFAAGAFMLNLKENE